MRIGTVIIALTSALLLAPAPRVQGARVSVGQLVLYGFQEGAGTTVSDRSGQLPALDLSIENPAAVQWRAGGGLCLLTPTVISSPLQALKITQAIATSGEVSLEAWIRTTSGERGHPASIVSLAGNYTSQNLTLGQGLVNGPPNLYEVRLRSTTTTKNGWPSLTSPAGTARRILTHVVFTRDATGQTILYLDGQPVAEGATGGDLSNWDFLHHLRLGNHPGGNRPWLGEYFLVAIFDRALGLEEVLQNHEAGPFLPPADQAPVLITQPEDQEVLVGQRVTFLVAAAGTPPLQYQWFRDGSDPIAGADGPSFTTNPVTLADNGATFHCLVSNLAGETVSDAATLSVLEPVTDRETEGLVVLYGFQEGSGNTVFDLSASGPPLDLVLEDPAAVAWLPAGGLRIDAATLVASPEPATKLFEAVTGSEELTIEAWIRPANITQNGPARIVTLSGNQLNRNFTLGQGESNLASNLFNVRLRSTTTTDNGKPSLNSLPGSLNTGLIHVVFTREATGTTRTYLDGALRATGLTGGSLGNWDPDFPLALANEPTGERPWLGTFHLVAVYDRPLSPEEIEQNRAAGPLLNPELNNPPDQPILVGPGDDQTEVATDPELRITVNDPNLDNLEITFFGRPANGFPPPPFAIVPIPDTQYYSQDYPEIFDSQTAWIAAQRDSLNIVFVPHLGDIVEEAGTEDQWLIANLAFARLECALSPTFPFGIPFSVVPGNHDYPTDNLNLFFGTDRFTGRCYYGGPYLPTSNTNSFAFFQGGGMDFILVNLDYVLDDDMLDWADNLLQTHSDKRAIVVSHFILKADGTFSDQGSDIYDALKDNPNLFLMLCGHIHGETMRIDTHNGNIVYTLLSNFQLGSNGGDGWLRILEFQPANDQIQVKTYSPYLDEFDTDSASQFTLDYPMDGYASFEQIGHTTGVASGHDVAVTWPGRDPGTEYQWFVQVSDGHQIATGQIWTFTTSGPVPGGLPGLLAGAPSPGAPAAVYALGANRPNPFNPSTRIVFSLPVAGPARLAILDLRGRNIATLADEDFGAGVHEVTWNGRDRHGRRLASGVYLYRLTTRSGIKTRKMVLVE